MNSSGKQCSSDNSTLSNSFKSTQSYNIQECLLGVCPEVYLHVIYEMADGRDITQFLLTNTTISTVILNKMFLWAVSPVAARSYSLSTVPRDKIEIV